MTNPARKDDEMKENTKLVFAWVIVLALAIVFMIAAVIMDGQIDAVCKSHGWTLGRHYIGSPDECIQRIRCTVDDVISGACKPIEVR